MSIYIIPNVEKISDGVWRLRTNWRFSYNGMEICVPAGTETDGASIPRPLWWLCGRPDRIPRLYAALVHDWIYSGGDKRFSRREADNLYRDMQVAMGISTIFADVEWVMLRMFGRGHWEASAKTV